MAGTGLPIPKSGNVIALVPQVQDGDRYSSAGAWSRIAAVGASIAKDGTDIMNLEVHEQKARALADFETSHSDFYTKARDEFAHDPTGFENAARAHNEAAAGEVPSWMAAHAKKYLGGKLESNLGVILGEKRARDFKLADDALNTRRMQSDGEIIGLVSAGKTPGTPEYDAAYTTYKGVLDTQVATGMIPPEKRDYLLDNIEGRAQGELAARSALSVYKTDGYEAAVEHLRATIKENDKLTLKPSERHTAWARGMEAINLQRKIDREDRVGIVQDAKDMISQFKANVPVDPGAYRDQLEALKRVGAWGAHRDLFIEQSVKEFGVKTGTLSLPEKAGIVGGLRTNISADAPSAVTDVATRLGVAPRDLAAAISYETGGTFNPNKWGGKGGNYFGLIQFGPEERRKYGVREGMTFSEQMQSVEGYLRDRGVKPGMGIAEIYSIINAGSLNAQGQPRYAASDGNATVRQHIENIQRNHLAAGEKFLGGTGVAATLDRAPTPYDGEILRRVQTEYAAQAKKDWPEFQAQIKAGKDIDEESFNAIRMAAAISGDGHWINEVESAAVGKNLGTQMSALKTAAEKQSFVDQVRAQFNDKVYSILNAQFERHQKMLKDDQVGIHIESGGEAPAPLDLSSAETARATMAEHVKIARGVAADAGVPNGVPLREGERNLVATAIQSGKPEQVTAAFEGIVSVPDDVLLSVLRSNEIKSSIIGAARSTDPSRFLATMGYLDQLYQRAPEEITHLFGGDTIKQLQDWQAKLRYYSPAALAEELKHRDDPQVRERHKKNVDAGEDIARKVKPESLIGEWQAAFGLFGASAPVDPQTRDAWLADYTNLYGERYAVSLDKTIAHKQAIERMKPYWNRSGVNGGRLTLYAPETVYQPVNGSHDWMRADLEGAITAKTGTKPSDYVVIADATTERDVTNRRAASYLVAVKNDATGEWDILRKADFKPHRFAWDDTNVKRDARVEFERQRQRVLTAAPPPDLGALSVP